MPLDPDQVTQLLEFLDILTVWSRRFGLVGHADPATLVRKHLLDSLAPAKVLGSRDGLIDIGSGAGLPGIPISIAYPRLPVVLVDSRQARVSFMREAVRKLALRNVTVQLGRIEDLIQTIRAQGTMDAGISRAWTGLSGFLDACSKLLRPGGIAVSMKGPAARRELAGIDAGALGFRDPELITYSLPGGKERRALLIFERC